ncbi:MAG: DUF5686 and carboxypeptidase regulatory-like domain-containing protein [Bacteroidales bacterium]|nr:DUF5686 and carboxypeptidase regulatory-like domain-containing protein [Bacteroidales bacterium]MCF8404910.1 DUF5686 and carboxypeptidase regulatory-like domain-containing protein [Bacteroidales bacterium]
MLNKNTIYFLFVTLIIFVSAGFGQETKIMGIVSDKVTHEPIPFANIYFQGTTIGVTSDFDGNFSIDTKTPTDTLVASVMGYYKKSTIVRKGIFQTINFELEEKNFNLPEVVILAGENPAEILLRKIIANKDKNTKKEFDAYQYETYNKIEIDANNISEKFKNRKILKPFKFIFDYVDTSAVNGKTYLPIFLSESLSDFYFRKDPRSEKEVIKAAKISGIENESALQFLGNMFQQYNIYDNYITIFQKNFVSPIADFGINSYKYYLVDSNYFADKWCYKIMFKPRRKQELTFTGHFWVHDTTYAIKSFELKIAEDANINYINDLVMIQEFEYIEDKYWMVVKDMGIGDFNVLEDNYTLLGFFGKKSTTYRNFKFNQLLEKKFYSTPTDVVVQDKAYKQEESFWEEHRHEVLTKDEKTIYQMIDTLQNLPAFKTWVDIVETIVTGYYERNKFEFGPYASLLSFNAIEGARIRVGGRTTSKFNEQFRLSGHIAYGEKDDRFKYGIGFLYLPNNNPRRAFGANYRYDIEQLGNSPNAFREDFFFAALFRRNPADKLSLTNEYKFYYEHEWFSGFINKINFMHKDIIPIGNAKVEVNNSLGDAYILDKITTTEVGFEGRFAYNEKFLMSDFERVSVGTKYPIIGFKYSYGIPNAFGSQYEYHRAAIGIRHWFNILNIGWSKYNLEAGKIWGTLPFPLLELHPGNETFLFDEYAFNLMNFFEFVSDEYVSMYYTHHFDGFFLNHIPLMRKLKWREVGFLKGVIGTLSDANKNYNELPDITHTLEKPYIEAGVGIENIFKVVRIDGIWRLSHLDNNNSNKFALFLSLYFTF